MFLRIVSLLAMLMLLAAPADAASEPVLTIVEPPPGDTWSFVVAINDRGLVLAQSDSGSFLWEEGEIRELIDVPGFYVQAVALNNRGDVAVNLYRAGETSRPAVWKEGEYTEFGVFGEAQGIDDRGRVVGWYGTSNSNAFLWEDHRLTDLGVLSSSVGWSRAHGINERGQVVGDSFNDEGNLHAVLWDGGSIWDLGSGGQADSEAYGVNNRGEIVGTCGSGKTLACLWSGGETRYLSALQGHDVSAAIDINQHGVVVGVSFLWPDVSTRRAIAWHDGVVTEIPPLPGFASSLALSINARGQVAFNSYAPDSSPFLSRGAILDLHRSTDPR